MTRIEEIRRAETLVTRAGILSALVGHGFTVQTLETAPSTQTIIAHRASQTIVIINWAAPAGPPKTTTYVYREIARDVTPTELEELLTLEQNDAPLADEI